MLKRKLKHNIDHLNKKPNMSSTIFHEFLERLAEPAAFDDAGVSKTLQQLIHSSHIL